MLFKSIFIMLFIYTHLTVASKPYIKKGDDVKRYFKSDEIILKYKAGTEFSKLEGIVKQLGAKIVYRSLFANFVTVRFDQKSNIWQLIRKFESLPEIAFAEPNGIVHMFWTPDDPYLYLQWNFDDTHLDMPLAWDVEQGGNSSVIVSILDTGVAYKTNLIPDYELTEVTSHDGYYHISPDLTMTNFVQGYDFINDDALPNDENGHGTHVCGTIAQSTNNTTGVAGMAFNVSIMPVRVLNETGSGTTDKIADGIYYAIQNGANVISMSFGGLPGDSIGFETVHDAIISATNAGAIVVAAAGNDSVEQLSYPAGFEECIAVGATNFDNNLAPYSQWGNGIDVVAPGGNLYDPLPGIDTLPAAILQSTYYQMNNGYYKATVDSFCYMFLHGTSMATPHVSALAALLISHGITNPSAVKQSIFSTCTDLGPIGYDTHFGYGLINPPVALGTELLFSSLPIIQNPYSQQYIDIWVVSNRPLLNDIPDTCRITLAGKDTNVNFEKVAEQTYRTDFFFDTSGTATIYVMARDTSGTKGGIIRHFTVTEVKGRSGGFAASEDGRFRVTIPEDIYVGVYWIVITVEDTELTSPSYISFSKVYQCGPKGNNINIPSIIQFHFNKEMLKNYSPYDLGIYRKNGEELKYLKTEIDIANGRAYATVKEFGTYVLLLWPGRGGSTKLDADGLSVHCYPIPVSQKLFFDYTIPFASFVDIALYDISGRKVKNVENGVYRDCGVYSASCNFEDKKLPSGIYFLRIAVSNGQIGYEKSKKVILMH